MEWEFDKGRQFRKQVVAWRKYTRDLRWAWPGAIRLIANHHRHLFATEGRGNRGMGSAWLPLSQRASDMRARHKGYYARSSSEGPDHRILQWTGGLRESLAARARGTSDSIRQYRTTSMTFGTRHPVADKHQRGVDVPVREIIDPEGSLPLAVKAIQRMLVRWMRSGTPVPTQERFY